MSKELKQDLSLASLLRGGIFLSFFYLVFVRYKAFFWEVFLKKGKLRQPYFTSITRERIQLINLVDVRQIYPISPLISPFKEYLTPVKATLKC